MEIVSSEDIAGEIFKFANIYKVNKLVIGKNMNMRFHLFQKPIYQYLLDNIDNINLIIVPSQRNRIFNRLNNKSKLTLNRLLLVFLYYLSVQ